MDSQHAVSATSAKRTTLTPAPWKAQQSRQQRGLLVVSFQNKAISIKKAVQAEVETLPVARTGIYV